MTGSLVDARPRLKSDVYFVPAVDGVVLRSNASQTLIKGIGTFAWIERLAPCLDGHATVAQLFGSLPETARDMAEGLVRTLIERGFAKDLTLDLPHNLSAEETDTYAAEITFIDTLRDSAEHRFERFRNCRPLLVGSGATFGALVRACLHSGARDVHAVTVTSMSGAVAAEEGWLASYSHTARDPGQELRTGHLNADDLDGLRSLMDRAGIVLSVTDRPMPLLAQTLARQCAATGVPLVQAVTVGDEAWIGPTQSPASAAGWEDWWLRLHAGEGRPPAAGPSPYLAGPTAALVGNNVCFLAFKHLTGIDEDTVPATVMRLDLATLDSEQHPVLPHPGAVPPVPQRAETVAAAVRKAAAAPAIDSDEFSRRVVPCLDDRVGLLRDLGEDRFEQVPRYVSRVRVIGPGPASDSGPPMLTYGDGPDVATSRRRAVLRGLALYAAQAAGFPAASAVYGYDLLDETTVALPSGTVSGHRSADGVPSPGLGYGLDWESAVCTGLLGHCEELIRAELAREGLPFDRLDLDRVVSGDDAVSCREQLMIIGHELTCYRVVTSGLAVPAVAVCLDGVTMAFACGSTLAEAVAAGLAQAVLADQADTHQQPEYRPRRVPDLPSSRRGQAIPAEPGPFVADGEPASRRLSAALRATGRRPLVIPLHQDPALAAIVPFLVEVVVVSE